MNDTRNILPPLDEFVDMRQLLPKVQHTFSTADSAKWFVRRHRGELADAGAMINIAGKLRFHPARFSEVAVEIGNQQVRGRG